MIDREVHSVNGKIFGVFYRFPDGRQLYLAHRSGEKCRAIHFDTNSWCLETTTLREVERRGCTAIGIAHRIGTRVFYYITNVDSFRQSPSESHPQGKTPQRRLARDKFLVNTALSAGNIDKSMKIGK